MNRRDYIQLAALCRELIQSTKFDLDHVGKTQVVRHFVEFLTRDNEHFDVAKFTNAVYNKKKGPHNAPSV